MLHEAYTTESILNELPTHRPRSYCLQKSKRITVPYYSLLKKYSSPNFGRRVITSQKASLAISPPTCCILNHRPGCPGTSTVGHTVVRYSLILLINIGHLGVRIIFSEQGLVAHAHMSA